MEGPRSSLRIPAKSVGAKSIGTLSQAILATKYEPSVLPRWAFVACVKLILTLLCYLAYDPPFHAAVQARQTITQSERVTDSIQARSISGRAHTAPRKVFTESKPCTKTPRTLHV